VSRKECYRLSLMKRAEAQEMSMFKERQTSVCWTGIAGPVETPLDVIATREHTHDTSTRKFAWVLRGFSSEWASFFLDRSRILLHNQELHLLSIEGDPQIASRWSIQSLRPAAGFAGALAVEGRGYRLHCWQWSACSGSFGRVSSCGTGFSDQAFSVGD
jgi:hypothetical protein